MNEVGGANQNIFQQINRQNESRSSNASTTKSNQDNDLFVRLMIAQLQNQDPTSPADTSSFTQQIATFSQVESVNNLTRTIESTNQSLLSSQAALQASSLVGRSVYVPGDTAAVGTQRNPFAQGSFNLGASSSNVRVQVFDSAGSQVDTLNLGALQPGDHTFAWQMELDAEGNPTIPAGDFTFVVQRFDSASDEFVPVDTNIAHRVNSVTLGENGIGLRVNTNAGSFDVNQVSQIGV